MTSGIGMWQKQASNSGSKIHLIFPFPQTLYYSEGEKDASRFPKVADREIGPEKQLAPIY